MTVLSNVTASASENENVVFRVLMWLNGIVEAFDDRNGQAADQSRPLHHSGQSKIRRDMQRRYALQLMVNLQYSPKVDTNHAVFISVSSSFLAKSCFFNRASTSAGR